MIRGRAVPLRGAERLPKGRYLAAHPSSLREARAFVKKGAAEVHISQSVLDDLSLAVSEACGNAVAHSGSLLILLSWQVVEGEIEVEIKDDGIFRRELPVPEDDEAGGYGIPLMMAVVDEFSIKEGTAESPGTVVRLRKGPARENGAATA